MKFILVALLGFQVSIFSDTAYGGERPPQKQASRSKQCAVIKQENKSPAEQLTIRQINAARLTVSSFDEGKRLGTDWPKAVEDLPSALFTATAAIYALLFGLIGILIQMGTKDSPSPLIKMLDLKGIIMWPLIGIFFQGSTLLWSGSWGGLIAAFTLFALNLYCMFETIPRTMRGTVESTVISQMVAAFFESDEIK